MQSTTEKRGKHRKGMLHVGQGKAKMKETKTQPKPRQYPQTPDFENFLFWTCY